MYDVMEPLAQFSPFAGQLVEEVVPGETTKQVEHENDVQAACGSDRTMWCYAPKSGCPDSKQTQVLFVLRDDSSFESAKQLMEELQLAQLAEEEHFLLLFPNPKESGWNITNDSEHENDMDYLARCFGLLRGSRLQVNGFNGMLFYLAVSEKSSALIANMIALRPAAVSAAMLGELPEDYTLPENALMAETSAWCKPSAAAEYLKQANRAKFVSEEKGIAFFESENTEALLFVSGQEISAQSVRLAWEKLFSGSRRWQNDTYGHYQHRTPFTERGFTAHIKDTSLGVNDNFPHTWFEYVPERLRGTTEKAPLLFYFHGVNCVPLYGAEQSNWHEVADKENLIVVYPAPARSKSWNIYDLPCLPSDFAFVLALIEHMKQVHPIDESRIYLSGFSMGGMMTHALASAYPELFAAAAPCNAFAFNRFKDPAETLPMFLRDIPKEELGHVSYSARLADEKKAAHEDYRMPVFQNAGMIDREIGLWPVTAQMEDARTKTLDWWKQYNHIPSENTLDKNTLTGLSADETFYQDQEERYVHQRWYSEDESHLPLLELLVAKRMPHAINPVQIEWAWEYMKHFSRGSDGELFYR